MWKKSVLDWQHKWVYVRRSSRNYCCNDHSTRFSSLKIQMLSDSLRNQVFGDAKVKNLSKENVDKVFNHLYEHKIDIKTRSPKVLPDFDFKLPSLLGSTIDEHFKKIAEKQIAPLLELSDLVCRSNIPKKPSKWVLQPGWSKYSSNNNSIESVAAPDELALIFDVEVLMSEGGFPIMATAMSPTAWYSWCSHRLFDNQPLQNNDHKYYMNNAYKLNDLIPLETRVGESKPLSGAWKQRLVISHNVSFDRSYVKEQYFIKGPRTKFIDTMSLHIAVAGFTSSQRLLFVAKKSGSQRKEVRELEQQAHIFGPLTFDWVEESTLNNLADVYYHYCKKRLVKEERDVFVKGTLKDVQNSFQSLMSYCAGDVEATVHVFKKLWPMFLERFPHPVTLAGMTEMGLAYLPINNNWQRYVQQAHITYVRLQTELQEMLQNLCVDACKMLENEKYKSDVWLWDLDWSVRKFPRGEKLQEKSTTNQKKKDKKEKKEELAPLVLPRWYVELCPTQPRRIPEKADFPMPTKITALRRITAKLLRLTWEGYPVYYDETHGWGYLVPGREEDSESELEQELKRQETEAEDADKNQKDNDAVEKEEIWKQFPIESLYEICKPILLKANLPSSFSDEDRRKILDGAADPEEIRQYWIALGTNKNKKKRAKPSGKGPSFHSGDGPYDDVKIPGCWFFKLPHKNGLGLRVGSPLSKDFMQKVEDGTLQAEQHADASKVLKYTKMCAYWKNAGDRIRSQIVVELTPKELPFEVTCDPSYKDEMFLGAIIPRTIVAGTVTRRAVEATWLTASNAYADRVGSELKAMVQAPPGYHFVGADVDSQELWIAALLGDAYFAGVHGCTAFGWMNLEGSKTDGSDLHSRVAQICGISRDQAKVFNYGRIYGAGRTFAERLLRQFDHKLTPEEAKKKALAMYTATKGKNVKIRVEASNGKKGSAKEKETDIDEDEDDILMTTEWRGGSESHMFNMLERIAREPHPRTPVLGCQISKTLEPKAVNKEFMTSRVNWVVQSSAVDYLHLMLVSMRWLCDTFEIDSRFSVSIHDEVRYLVKSEDRYRAALALQITNLLTRCMFAYKLGMNDLPRSIAFFSAVDIDQCLRKEVTMECVTPSNILGLSKGYGLLPGEALDMSKILNKTKGTLVKQSKRSKQIDEKMHSISDIANDVDVRQKYSRVESL